jgi:hypothetical protein
MVGRTPREIALAGQAREERTLNKQSVQELLKAAVLKRADANNASVSEPTRLDAAYDAILFCALAVFAADRYRITSSEKAHHELAIEGLAATLGFGQTLRDELDTLRRLRGEKYTGFTSVRPADLKLALAHAERVIGEVEAWFATRRPELLR